MSIAILSKKKQKKQKQPKETLQQTLLSCVFMFACVLIFHAIVFQPFQIPSGSMAPTLLGNHLRVTCEQCGYTFKLDSHIDKRYFQKEPPIICPMCAAPNRIKNAQVSSGDRIIVQKFAYEFTDPKRWDVVVFKTPQHLTNLGGEESRGPVNDFIKRCIGLPNENLRILDGNVYVQQLKEGANGEYVAEGDYKIARKHENEKAQRAMFVPIYYSQYIPNDGGYGSHRVFSAGGLKQQYYWSTPWVADADSKSNWQLDKVRTYEYKGKSASTITFDFKKSNAYNIFAVYPYNQFRRPFSNQHPVEDIRLGMKVDPQNGAADLVLSTTGRWMQDERKLSAAINKDGFVTLTSKALEGDDERVLGKAEIKPITSMTDVELWFIDQELALLVNGEIKISVAYDMSMDAVMKRPAASITPTISIQTNSPVKLHEVELDRDLYYTSKPLNKVAHGGLHRENGAAMPAVDKTELALHGNEFFMVGDNTPWSNDSRFWDSTEPWVSANYMSGDGDRDRGIVPRELLVGKAMMVFYPGTHKWFIPHFGDMRLIH
ncbi:signal peptidase I [Planctomycetota bacterium]|nr:signal peptidase I [Planctomycetota bacterium]